MAGFMLDNLKIIGLNVQDYIVDFLLFIIIGLLTNLITYLLFGPIHAFLPQIGLPKDYDIFPLTFGAFKVGAWIVGFLFTRWLMGNKVATLLSAIIKNEYFFDSEIKGKRLTEDRVTKEWVIQGNISVKDGGLLISNSNSGCFVKPRYIFSRIWKDFTATMTLVFLEQSYERKFQKILGIVFRAQNFDDYFF